MKTVVHLIPYDGIGGVEAAARTMRDLADPHFDFQVRYLFPEVASREGRRATFNPVRFLTVAVSIARQAPDALVVSLWRCVLVGVLVKALNRRIRLVVFLHNAEDAHRADRFATRLAVRLCDAVWADSAATVAARLDAPPSQPVTVISYLTRRLEPLPDAGPAPAFAFWGRLSAQKNVGRALALFAEIRRRRPDARFLVIGPDGGEEAMLRRKADAMGLGDGVTFAGPLAFETVLERLAAFGAAFCLQTSRYEGMALSVAEAMQLGLVPVVTPVGEIGRYCVDGKNALCLPVAADEAADAAAAGRVLALLDDPARYAALRAAAIATWEGRRLYRDSVMDAARALFAGATR